jgi:hypothetical protein
MINLQTMKIFVRAASLYNASAAIVFLTPGFLPFLGVTPPNSPFWLWLPSIFACFAAIVLWFSARDLTRFGSFPYWNGLFRLAFVIVAFALNFGDSVGQFITYLALGDLVLALGTIFGVKAVTQKTHWKLLTNT